VSDNRSTIRQPVVARTRLVRILPAPAETATPEATPVPTGNRWDHADQPEQGALARLGGAAFDPGRPGIRVLAAVTAVVVCAAAVFAWWSRPRPEPLVAQLTATTEADTHVPEPTAPAELVVAVTGMVRTPGLVRLPPGSRVADAVDAAGGLLPEAEVDYLNLARKLTDGELVAVGIPPPPDSIGGAPGAGGSGGKINLNLATQAELETLPGVGPALAQRIITYRTDRGPFGSVTELRQVSGIGDVRFAELRDLVTV
jgi:competence protein ComEA